MLCENRMPKRLTLCLFGFCFVPQFFQRTCLNGRHKMTTSPLWGKPSSSKWTPNWQFISTQVPCAEQGPFSPEV